MPLKEEPPPRAVPRWQVVAGKASGGLVVREGAKLSSAELGEKLATGAVVEELELQGERLHYKLVTGSGPPTGWVSIKVKGKETLTPRPTYLWVLCGGTRGDVQPYIALSAGLLKAGYRVRLLTTAENQRFAEDFGLAYTRICRSVEDFILEATCNKNAWSLDTISSPLLDPIKDENGHIACEDYGDDFVEILAEGVVEVPAIEEELARERPDALIIGMVFMAEICLNFALKHDIPALWTALQPVGMSSGPDPTAPYVTEEMFKSWQQESGVFKEFKTLADAREALKDDDEFAEDAIPEKVWEDAVRRERVFLSPQFGGMTPIKDMGRERYGQFRRENILCGFLSSLSGTAFLSNQGVRMRRAIPKNIYTGFWKVTAADADACPEMFGGEETKQRLEEFINAGPAPVYIGWGSCIGFAGPRKMIILAVDALRQSKQRGILLGGWAKLSNELLKDTVDELMPGDPSDLLKYAKENIFFASKLPHGWLFPKCSCLVVHGGVGTLAVCWESGTPTIVCPVWFDQFGNAQLHSFLAGLHTAPVDECEPSELAEAITKAVTDPLLKRSAQVMQFSMYRDKGVATATAHINKFLATDARDGTWRARLLPPPGGTA